MGACRVEKPTSQLGFLERRECAEGAEERASREKKIGWRRVFQKKVAARIFSRKKGDNTRHRSRKQMGQTCLSDKDSRESAALKAGDAKCKHSLKPWLQRSETCGENMPGGTSCESS